MRLLRKELLTPNYNTTQLWTKNRGMRKGQGLWRQIIRNMALSRDFLVDPSIWDWLCMEGKTKCLSHGHKSDLQIVFVFMP